MPAETHSPSDSDVIIRVLAGECDEFAHLVRRYRHPVFALAYARLGNHADAEDVAQETFVKAFKSLGTLREKGKFRHWLVTIARNECSHMDGRRAREKRTASAVIAEQIAQPDVERQEISAHKNIDSEILYRAGNGQRKPFSSQDISPIPREA